MIAIVVLIAAGAWVATGKFSYVGSAIGEGAPQQEAQANAPTAPAETAPKVQQTVAFIRSATKDYVRQFRISGKTRADKQTVLAARTSGVIAKLPVEKGARVAAGDLLMALDGPDKYTAVEAAKSQLATAKHQAEANAKLFASGKISSLANDNSQTALSSAQSALAAAQSAVDQLEVRAPFAGVVDNVMVEKGAWVTPGTSVASLLSLDPILAVGEVSERDLHAISVGDTASVAFGDGTSATGKVRYISREASAVTLTFPIEIAVPNPEGKISAGMSADITLSAKPVPSTRIPRSVITLGSNGEVGVRTVETGDVVGFLPVNILEDTPDGLIVTGIPDGTRVIVSGQDLVIDGEKVTAVDNASSANAAGGSK